MNVRKLFFFVLLIVLTRFCGNIYSQSADSLNIYPNPFNVSTSIYFETLQADTITLKAYNSNGESAVIFIESLVLAAGVHNVNWNADTLEDGIYFIKLDIGATKSITKKAIKQSNALEISANKDDDLKLVYPNPAKQTINIPISGLKTIIIEDYNGRVLEFYTTEEQSISIDSFKNGKYLLTVFKSEQEVLSTQIVIE